MFMVVTTTGARVFDNSGQGFEEAQATANVADRNARAEAMGLAVRYEVAPFVKAAK